MQALPIAGSRINDGGEAAIRLIFSDFQGRDVTDRQYADFAVRLWNADFAV
jgi:hypothetical protein